MRRGLCAAVLADLHLCGDNRTSQYAALLDACAIIRRERSDVLLSLGDASAFGSEEDTRLYLRALRDTGVPLLSVAGNSDLRTPETASANRTALSVGSPLRLDPYTVMGLDDADGTLREADMAALKQAIAAGTPLLVCMHMRVPLPALPEGSVVLCGHTHDAAVRQEDGVTYCRVPAADPDKAIGVPPSVTLLCMDGETVSLRTLPLLRARHASDLPAYLGFSCYDPLPDIDHAIACGVRSIELRPGVTDTDRAALREKIRSFRASGGRYLSLHLPDMPRAGIDDALLRHLELAETLGADGVTIHIPGETPEAFRQDAGLYAVYAAHYAALAERLDDRIGIGVENMHTTPGRTSDSARRWGCVPEEMLDFRRTVNALLGRERVQLHLDVGHARNNAPFSQHYPVSVWYAQVGGVCNAYHVHQVSPLFQNHQPIEEPYAPLVNYSGFLWSWENGLLRRRPVILEIPSREGRERSYRALRSLCDGMTCSDGQGVPKNNSQM